MKMNIIHSVLVTTALFLFYSCETQVNQERTWSIYKADEKSSNYSPLNQITTVNVNQLRPAWTFTMHDKPAGSQPGRSE